MPDFAFASFLTPESAIFPSTDFPQLKKNVGTSQLDYTLDFDTTTQESASWRIIMPSIALWSGATIRIFSRQAVVVVGTVGWLVTTLTRGDGQAFDTVGVTDTVTAATVKGTAGQVLMQSKALTITGWTINSVLLIKIARDVASDTAVEDTKFISAAIELT